MPALHTSAALGAPADVDVETPDHGPPDREIRLIRRRDTGAPKGAPTRGARVRQRRGVLFIDASRPRSTGTAAIRRTSAASGSSALTLRTILRKRRGLAKAGASGCIQWLCEAVVLTLEPIALARGLAALLLGACPFVAHSRDLTLLALDPIVAIIPRRLRAVIGHTTGLADSRKTYKYGTLDLAALDARTR